MLQAAGVLAILSALGHGFLGDKTLRAQAIEPEHLKSFVRFCYQFGSAGWMVGGLLFLTAPSELSAESLRWLILITIPMYGFGAVVNAWFTRGRHFGWVMLAAIVGLALLSLR